MSSLRNAVKRRTHKERSQPAERRKFGLLEKKKDYILRARDFHKKEEALKVLRKKAANRNPDEFYFAMQKQRTNDGVHIANEDLSNKYTQDELHLMKTQDVKYVAMKASMEAKKVEKLRATLHMIGDVPGEDDAMDDDDDDSTRRGRSGRAGRNRSGSTSCLPTSPTRRMRTPDSDAPSRRRGTGWCTKSSRTPTDGEIWETRTTKTTTREGGRAGGGCRGEASSVGGEGERKGARSAAGAGSEPGG